MEQIIACCGIKCNECGAFIATQEDDHEKRKEIAAGWSKQYGHDFKPEDINCDGCLATGRHLGYAEVCEIRKCGLEKKVVNCAYCDDYACEKLGAFLEKAPQFKANLDEIRKGLK